MTLAIVYEPMNVYSSVFLRADNVQQISDAFHLFDDVQFHQVLVSVIICEALEVVLMC